MLFAAVGYFHGYDGHFNFDNIGDTLVDQGVPYVSMRLLSAFCGTLIVPLSFLTLKDIGCSLLGCVFGAYLILIGLHTR
jgi:dolichyl-phosphate-mannose-protein mannosyltransferase